MQATTDLGIARTRVVLDPGIGFGKTSRHNLELLAHLDRLGKWGRPVCLGVSRKGFLGRMLDRPVEARLPGSLAVACHAMSRGSARSFVSMTSDRRSMPSPYSPPSPAFKNRQNNSLVRGRKKEQEEKDI